MKEVAERLKVSEATVRQWVRNGDLRAIDIGKGCRIADSDLDAFLSAHETRARASAETILAEPAGRNGGLE